MARPQRIRPLNAAERACLTCPLSDCLPEHPRCPRAVLLRRKRPRRRRRKA